MPVDYHRVAMVCPHCGHGNNKITVTRGIGRDVRRTRECTRCERTFSTWEITDVDFKMIRAIRAYVNKQVQ